MNKEAACYASGAVGQPPEDAEPKRGGRENGASFRLSLKKSVCDPPSENCYAERPMAPTRPSARGSLIRKSHNPASVSRVSSKVGPALLSSMNFFDRGASEERD